MQPLAARDAFRRDDPLQRGEIDPRRARDAQPALVAEHGGDTSYFAVADGAGNAVSFIHSLSNSFGSGVVAGDTGVTLNNRAGRGFSVDPVHPNVIAPGRRTMHTLNAWMIFRDGEPWLVGGTPGGDQPPLVAADRGVDLLPQHEVDIRQHLLEEMDVLRRTGLLLNELRVLHQKLELRRARQEGHGGPPTSMN